MRVMFCAGFAIVLGVAPASAGERENAMKHIAMVTAVQSLCSQVEVNDVMVALIATSHKIDFERDRPELLAMVNEQAAPWRVKGEDAACAAGIVLYGPNGGNVPNLLKWK